MAIVIDAQGNLVDTEGRIQFNDSVYQSDPFGRFGLDYNPASIGGGINQDYLGKGMTVSSMGVGPNLNYLGKGMQLGSFGDPEQIQYRPTGIQTMFPTDGLPALSDLGGITPSYGVANEEDVEQEFLPGQKKSDGIADLFKTLIGFAVPGASFFLNKGRDALGGIRNLNQRLRNTDFGRSRNLADYFDMKKYGGYQGREDARAATMAQARGIQKKIDRGDYGTRDTSIDRGRGQTPSRTTSSPRRSSGFSSSARGRALHG